MAFENTKVYLDSGGDRMVVKSGGEIEIESGATITDDGTQASTIAALEAAYETPELDTEAKLIVAINATNTALNAVIAALKGVGIIATS